MALSSAAPAAAWGTIGHKAIIMLAEQHLTPEAANEVQRLIRLEETAVLADVAMWADRIRVQNLPGTPAHDVEIPLQGDFYDAARDCKSFCIVEAIPFYLEILADRTKPDLARLEALKYVVHLVGDVHQPLHASQDGGGQLVAWEARNVYLHLLWDVDILRSSYKTPDLLAEAVSKRVRPLASCDGAAQWANESNQIARDFVFPALGPNRSQPIILPADYGPRGLSLIEERIALAGMRLSCVLNGALDPRQ